MIIDSIFVLNFNFIWETPMNTNIVVSKTDFPLYIPLRTVIFTLFVWAICASFSAEAASDPYEYVGYVITKCGEKQDKLITIKGNDPYVVQLSDYRGDVVFRQQMVFDPAYDTHNASAYNDYGDDIVVFTTTENKISGWIGISNCQKGYTTGFEAVRRSK